MDGPNVAARERGRAMIRAALRAQLREQLQRRDDPGL
jgi:hypothetical protein